MIAMTDQPPKQGKTLAQLFAEARGADPWACPRCGCKDWIVHDTRDNARGNRDRTRLCRHCGRNGPRLMTEETPRSIIIPEQ